MVPGKWCPLFVSNWWNIQFEKYTKSLMWPEKKYFACLKMLLKFHQLTIVNYFMGLQNAVLGFIFLTQWKDIIYHRKDII